MSERRFDAVIVGAGPSGGTAALLLTRAGWSVAVLERKEFPRRKVCGEYVSATNLPLLDHLDIGRLFRDEASPPVTHVGLFAGERVLTSAVPRPGGTSAEAGRGLAREKLDALLLQRAAEAGASVWQPWGATRLERDGEYWRVSAEELHTRKEAVFSARIVVLAHGSWESGTLPSQSNRARPSPSDLLAFKAHFRDGSLPTGLMPFLTLPGAYGGMVHCGDERFSLSFCVRRDVLAAIRAKAPNLAAGEAVAAFAQEHCRGVREALRGARLEGTWLAAGPIRPGVRLHMGHGVFPVGNVAGEVHPAAAEGISIAMQSAWLIARRLIAWKAGGAMPDALIDVEQSYSQAWRQWFVPRLRAGSVIAQWSMRPIAVASVLPLLRLFPRLLTLGARFTGKATRLVQR